MSKKKALAYKAVTAVMTLLLTFSSSPFTALATQAATNGSQETTYSDEGAAQELSLPSDELSSGKEAIADGESSGEESAINESAADESGDGEAADQSEANGVAGEQLQEDGSSESGVAAVSDDDSDNVGATDRAAEAFDANSYIKKLTLSLTSGDVTRDYEAAGTGIIDTREDFPSGLARTATYVASLDIDTKTMLEAQGKYPFVKGDTVTCSMPDIIRTGSGTTSGRLIDGTAIWNDTHNGVGDYTVTQDAQGHNILTITYDDGYVDEKDGRIIASSVRLSGGFDTSDKTTESFETDLIFGSCTVKTKFSKLEIIRNLSIEKTGARDDSGPDVYRSTPSYPRSGGASIDSNGCLTYAVTVTAGTDNTYKLTNVKVIDLFDTASQAKVYLSSMTLVSVDNDGKDTTGSAKPLYDNSGNINGWNIGDLGIGCSATVTFKVKINKEGITAAVDADKDTDSSSDAAAGRTIKNTATASADDTNPVSHEYSTIVKNYVTASKITRSFDSATQRQHFTITVTSPADNRYTMHDVPIHDYLGSVCLDASCYAGSGIASMTVKHSDGTTESLAWNDLKQIDSSGNADTRSWYATISELRPGDVVTINAYLEVNEAYWANISGAYAGNGSTTNNYVYVGNLGENGYCAADLNKVFDYSTFFLRRTILIKDGKLDKSNGTVFWTIAGNERNKTKEAVNVGGLLITDTLGPDQKFTGNTATVTFYSFEDGSVVGTDSVYLADGATSFTYTIPEDYGTCEYKITFTSTITDWDTYVGPAKSYTNTVNGYTASTAQRARVAAMSKQFVQQADDWSQWKTSIYSKLENGDTYLDTSRKGVNYMYYTDDDLAAIELSIDGVALDTSLYQIDPVQAGSSAGKYAAYKITFKGDISVEKDGKTVVPSKDHPLVVSYKAHMVNPSYGDTRDYYNDATLTTGNVSDSDYDFCRRTNREEVRKSVFQSGNGKITWYLRSNYYGYSGQPDGTCTVTDTLPAGLTYDSYRIQTDSRYGTIDSVTPVVNADGTTTLTIKISGLQHDEVCNAHPIDHNGQYEFQFYITTRITDPEYLYGTESKTFDFTNTVSLSDRYGNLKTSSATANVEHRAMKKGMVYSQATAPYAQFSIEANADQVDLNPDGDTVRIVDESSKSLSIDARSISVVDAKTGDPVDFTLDTSQMASNIFVVEVPDNTYVKIAYQAQVIGVIGENVTVSNNAYYEGYRTTSGESTIEQSVVVLKTSGEAESEPMVWFSKESENGRALAGATYKLDAYDAASASWVTLRDDIESTDNNLIKGVKVEGLELNTLYRLVEIEAPGSVSGAPQGYVLDTTPHYFVLYKDTAPTVVYPGGVDPDDVFVGPSGSTITAYDAPYTCVRFAKMSTDGAQLGDGEFTVYSVDADGNVSDDPAHDKAGNEVKFTSSADAMNEFVIAPGTYQVVETKTPAGYASADPVTFVVKGDSAHTVTVNGRTVQTGTGETSSPITGNLSMTDATRKTSLSVTKAWSDCSDFDDVRPRSATVQLVADGELVVGKTLELNEANNWTASFDDLDVMKAGKKIEYSVKEIDSISGDAVDSGSTMKNGYQVSVSATSGDVVSGADDGYAVTVTNSYTPATTCVNVTKAWDDADDQDGVRPESVEVQLFADGKALDGKTVTLYAAKQWKASFENLPAAHEDGSAIVYTVKEVDPATGEAVELDSVMQDGYKVQLAVSEYSGYPNGANPTGIDDLDPSGDDTREISYGIVNSRTPDTTTIKVSKKWIGPGTDSVSVKLQSSADDGTEWTDAADASATLSDENEWSATFDDLPVYAAGQQGVKLIYRVVEDAVDGYETSYLVDDETSDGEVAPVASQTESVTVVNTNTEKIEVAGTKVWNDDDNQDGVRPEKITVRLLADGEEIATTELTSADATDDDASVWAFSFGDLAKYDSTDGHEIVYTVTEDEVEGYESEVTGSVADGFVVTNTKKETPAPAPDDTPSEKPSGSTPSSKSAMPKTGDTSGAMIATYLGAGALMLVAGMLEKVRRRMGE